MNESIPIQFGRGINPDHAERVIATLGADESPNQKVILCFDEYPYLAPGVGWRIGNALRRYSAGLLEVRTPPFLNGQGEWFRSFTRSCLGDAFAAHAATVHCGGEDTTATIREYYADKTARKAQNSVVTGALHEGVNVDPEREDLFRDDFLKSLRLVNVKSRQFDPERLRDVMKLAFEAIQNVYDHATRKPLSSETEVLSYVLTGYYKTVGNHPDPAGRLKVYLERLASIANRTRSDFIEVCVNDDGVGIAARQSQDPTIYWGPKMAEEDAVREALTSRSSVKLRSNDTPVRGTPGQGYTFIDSSLRALRAFAVLRTGRLLAVLDGTEDVGGGFTLVPGNLGYMPGTTIDVLIPILNEEDRQPSLFPDE